MCGIFAYVGRRQNASEIVLDGLKRLEYRGYDSWGVAVASSGKFFTKKRVGKIGSANVSELPKSNFGFGHTRWATHGGVTGLNSHPHFDCSGEIAVIHNGIIENYEEIKAGLFKKGHKFISETDTEVFAHLVEEFLAKNDLAGAVQKAFKEVSGLNAFIVMKTDERKFIALGNGSPLVVGFGKGENFLASDPAALLTHTKRVYFLADNQLALVSVGKVEISDIRTHKKIIPKIITLPWSAKHAEKGTFKHYMMKEIFEQPEIILDIAQTSVGEVEKLAKLVKKSFGAYLIGCGTAAYAALAGTYLMSKIAKRHMNSAVGSEFNYQADFLTPKSLVIALSQSGETMDTLEAVKSAHGRGAKVAALVNVLGSTLYRKSDMKILIKAGPEKAVASTKAFTGKIAHLLLLAYTLAGKTEEGKKVVISAAEAGNLILKKKSVDAIKKIASKIYTKEHIFVVGRGLSYPASLETSLKIKEISYIHAEGLAAGELKHGTLALIEKGTPCIVFLPNDETYGANLAGAMELSARGGMIIGVSFKPHEIFDEYINVADAREGTIIPNVMVGQLLAYFLTLKRGFDPDMPRNLAKSVTVK